jgi:hypothetical protein
MTDNAWLNKPVFICGHRKTGTTMLLALFDNHPELVVFPPDSGFFYDVHPRYSTADYTPEQRRDRVAEVMIRNLAYEYSLLPEAERQDLESRLDELRGTYLDLAGGTDSSSPRLLQALIEAFNRVYQHAAAPVGWMEKTTSTEIYAAEVKAWFPEAKFIHVLRDPRDNWASLKSGWTARYQHFNDEMDRLMQSLIDRGRTGMAMARDNASALGKDCYHVIRFEDLVSDPKRHMAALCEFIGVGSFDQLMTPTVSGKLWRGNNFDGLSFDRPSAVNVGRWRERITPEEAALVEFHFADLMAPFGYEPETSAADRIDAARRHYQWHNFAQLYSAATTKD